MAKEYYLISDLHIGGDDQLQICDFEDELIQFLKKLEAKSSETELIIIGDVFGLWELTTAEEAEKLDVIIEHHVGLFAQLKATGERIKITLIPGNHDYELACYPEYVQKLRDFNVLLEQKISITRDICGKKIWIEHGMQDDANNNMPDFGNPHAQPVGYFVTHKLVGTAGRMSKRGKYNWLRDIQSVSPMEETPGWIISNYFYREMNPLLRYSIVPFLILFNVSLLYSAGALLENFGVLPTRIFLDDYLTSRLGLVGNLLNFVFFVNGIIISILILVSIPLGLFIRDARKTLERFGVLTSELVLDEQKSCYLEAAQEVFLSHPDVAVYVFGHTHEAFLETSGKRAVINTGTWLKILEHVPSRFKWLPDIYWPSFRLNYFCIGEDAGRIVIDYQRIEKEAPQELSLLQRIAAVRRKESPSVPERTILNADDL